MTKRAIMTLVTLCLSCGDFTQPNSQNPPRQYDSHPAAQPNPNTSDAVAVYAWNNRADVYDLANGRANVRSKNRLDRPTEFGGALDFCNTESLYCLRSYLEIVVPRKFPFPSHWSTQGYECRQLDNLSEASDIVKAECRLRENWTTTFEYSPKRGVVRYRRICPRCDDGSYELLSERGLFPAS